MLNEGSPRLASAAVDAPPAPPPIIIRFFPWLASRNIYSVNANFHNEVQGNWNLEILRLEIPRFRPRRKRCDPRDESGWHNPAKPVSVLCPWFPAGIFPPEQNNHAGPIIKMQRTCPILSGPKTKPSCASGSRKN